MSRKMEKVLFVTSFVPVAAFKIIARVGDATWEQAKACTPAWELILLRYLRKFI